MSGAKGYPGSSVFLLSDVFPVMGHVFFHRAGKGKGRGGGGGKIYFLTDIR